MSQYKELDVVVLEHDLPEFGLDRGHLGTVVLVYGREAVEVEFMDREGSTHAVLTVLTTDLRHASPGEKRDPSLPPPWPAGTEAPIADATTHVRP